MTIIQKLLRCRFCGSNMTDRVSPESYQASPFCLECLPQRVKEASEQRGKFEIVRDGTYFRAIPASEKAASDD